jgi:cytochrome c
VDRAEVPLRSVDPIARLAVALVLTGCLLFPGEIARAELRGHGGPVRAIAITADGAGVVTGGFDERLIRWALPDERAVEVLHFHAGSVNAVVMLPGGGFASAGADGRIALWRPGEREPDRVLEGHTAPVVGLALSPDGRLLASAGWDRTVRLWPLAGGPPRVLEGHKDNINGVAFLAAGQGLASAGYDGILRLWPLGDEAPPQVLKLGVPLNAVAALPGGGLVVAGADGALRFVSAEEQVAGTLEVATAPLTTLAVSPDGRLLAAAGIRGAVQLVDLSSHAIRHSLVGPGMPVWALAFTADGSRLFTGGSDGLVRRWDTRTGEPLDDVAAPPPLALPAGADPRGAEVFAACAACHALGPDDQNRAGPTLYGLFGRRIATAPGYRYSPALEDMAIVWTPETVAALFTEGPATYTPGTRMPEQVIRDPADLAALIRFLKTATAER